MVKLEDFSLHYSESEPRLIHIQLQIHSYK